MPLIEIADFNRDGMFDLLYARPETQEIVVLYNKLSAQTANSDQLCHANSNSNDMIYTSNPKTSSGDALVYKTDVLLNLASVSATIPGRLRIADFDHDGFIDILMTVVNADQTSKTYLYTNVDGSESDGG
jgi:hypothetical protein